MIYSGKYVLYSLLEKIYNEVFALNRMVRKRVVGTFLGLIFLAAIIFFIQSNSYEGVTGFSISSGLPLLNEQVLSGSGEGFDMRIENAKLDNSLLVVDYSVEDKIGENHKLDVQYLVHDSSGRKIQSGGNEANLGENQKMKYSLSFALNENLPSDSYLTLYVFDGETERRALVPLIVGSNLITGSSVGEQKVNSTIFFFTMLIGLIFLFYCIKLVEAHRIRRQNIDLRSRDRFIQV